MDASRAAIERSLDPRPHGILGVPPNADEAMVRKSYRLMAKLLHPDKCQLPEAEAAFKRVKDAFEILIQAEAWKSSAPPPPNPAAAPSSSGATASQPAPRPAWTNAGRSAKPAKRFTASDAPAPKAGRSGATVYRPAAPKAPPKPATSSAPPRPKAAVAAAPPPLPAEEEEEEE